MKAWEGRFSGGTDPLMERFSASIDVDKALFLYDIEGSKAHAEMLARIGILTAEEARQIAGALDEIKTEISEGKMVFSADKEDIHMHVEARLVEKIGDTGKKLHTARSRNDQVSLDMRMYVKEELGRVNLAMQSLLSTLLEKASAETRTLMPGYTHLQRAQVVTFAHYLMSYYHMFRRDMERVSHAISAADSMPLGSGAIAGSTIPLDREFVRERLGFSRISENSIDAVADRDFAVDSVYVLTMIMIHLSRLAEDMVLFSTEEFSFIRLPDSVCTGSSLMPQKKNPDALELVRGKTARVMGDLTGLLTLLKGLPLAYNRDLQEDKEPLFHAVTTAKDCLAVTELAISGLEVNRETMEEAVMLSFMPATEMAEYLVLKGVPFREAHGVVGRIVKHCEAKKKGFFGLTLQEIRGFYEGFEEDVFAYIDPRAILENRRTAGSASFREVEKSIEKEKLLLHS